MPLPARPLLALLTLWTALSVLAALRPETLLGAWGLSGWALAGLALLDLGFSKLRRPLGLERALQGTLPVGAWSEVGLRILNRSPWPRRVEVFDDLPASIAFQGLPARISIPARGWAELRYRVRPLVRGPMVFGACHLREASILGLWRFRQRVGAPSPVRIFPNFAPVKKYAELAVGHRLSQLGIHRRRRRGEGREFHQLREYREGDSLRQIDWKATARMRRLISKEYQEERDQQVILLLDCGRRMRGCEGGQEALSHFDQTLTALLLLAFVALREGDAVGLLTFGAETRWMPPRKGRAALDDLMERLYDLEAGSEASDYLAAAEALGTRHRKRALVVLATSLRDEDDDTLAPALALMRNRHRVLLASLRDPAPARALEGPIRTFEEALLHGAIHDDLERQRLAFQRLDTRGILTLDALPRELPVALVNRYLALKRSGD